MWFLLSAEVILSDKLSKNKVFINRRKQIALCFETLINCLFLSLKIIAN
jgi:hypothetical protein